MGLIGITADIEPRAQSGRLVYFSPCRLADAVGKAGGVPVILAHDRDQVDAYIDGLDGILVSGGGFQFPTPDLLPDGDAPVDLAHKWRRARFELALVRSALARAKPILCICGGFQVLNAVLGGELIVDIAASFATTIAHNQDTPAHQASHDVSIAPGSQLARMISANKIPVNSFHRQGVIQTGAGVIASAHAPDGLVEAIEWPDHPFALGVQWHPEWSVSPHDDEVMQAFIRASTTRL